mmetsp:Transcript_47501/g.54688  ORF Transcript_47501/g.54688 Transcript_47501/m.54688 type:complete len:211 (+) Transcript_47501:156-788(+)
MRFSVALLSAFLILNCTNGAWVQDYIMFNYGTQSNVALFSNDVGTNGLVLQELWSDINLSYPYARFTVESQSCTGTFSIRNGDHYIRAPSSKTEWVDTQSGPYGLAEFTLTPLENNWYSIQSVHGWYLSTTGREVYQADAVGNHEKWAFMTVASGTPTLIQQGNSFLRRAAKKIEERELALVVEDRDGLLPSDWQKSDEEEEEEEEADAE